MIGDLQQKLMASAKVDRVIDIGTPHDDPDVSIIVPLYRVLGFLRAQIGAFACDDWVAKYCELVFVLDSPNRLKNANICCAVCMFSMASRCVWSS